MPNTAMLTKRGRGSAILLAVSVAGLLTLYLWDRSIVQIPLDMPLPLRAGETQAVTFAPSATDNYLLEVEAKLGAAGADFVCLLTNGDSDFGDAVTCPPDSSVLDISWTVMSGGHELLHGDTRNQDGFVDATDDERAHRTLHSINARRGQTYTMTVQANADMSALIGHEPRLRAVLQPLYGLGPFLIGFVPLVIGAAIGALGLLWVFLFSPLLRPVLNPIADALDRLDRWKR